VAPRPNLINLPQLDGHEVLAQIKQDDSLKFNLTIVLTTSDAEVDILKAINCTRTAT
jgi:CheY-like chemotaxis protein